MTRLQWQIENLHGEWVDVQSKTEAEDCLKAGTSKAIRSIPIYPHNNPNDEPKITINGVELNQAQSMTVRVAIGAYFMEMQDENFLGDDEHGKRMTKAYRDRSREIIKIISQP